MISWVSAFNICSVCKLHYMQYIYIYIATVLMFCWYSCKLDPGGVVRFEVIVMIIYIDQMAIM